LKYGDDVKERLDKYHRAKSAAEYRPQKNSWEEEEEEEKEEGDKGRSNGDDATMGTTTITTRSAAVSSGGGGGGGGLCRNTLMIEEVVLWVGLIGPDRRGSGTTEEEN